MRNLMLAIGFAGAIALIAPATNATDAERPAGPNDAIVAEALAALKAVDAAVLAHDVAAFEAHLAIDLVVNNPINTVTMRDAVIERFRNDQIKYSAYERKIELAVVRGDGVVVMGEETVKPIGNAPNAGKTVRRRFTDIWKKSEGAWKLAIRQATVIAVE